LQGSDAHRLTRDPKDKNRLGVGDRVVEFCLPEVSFEALKSVFENDDFSRIRPYRAPSEEPFDHVQAAREEGNTIVQAFHESMTQQGGRLNKVLADVVAFANTHGGTVYIGVSAARKGAPKGVENAEQAVATLKKEIERTITPFLECRVDVIASMNVPVVRITVPNGPDKPYALDQTRIYVRQENETSEAVRDEMVQLVLQQYRERAGAGTPAQASEVAPRAPAGNGGNGKSGRSQAEPAGNGADGATANGAGSPPPAIGVEVLRVDDRKGSRVFSIRDLRNGNVIHNVSSASARKLWSYAIQQHLSNPVDPSKVEWQGDMGVWQVARRAKRLRYDLCLRGPGDQMRVFYGVTADGMPGPWQQFLKEEDRAE
jgi:hypothetical protein